MTNVEVILSVALGFALLCLLFMYIKLSEVSTLMDILDDRSRSNRDKIEAISARMQDIRKTKHDERIKEKMVKYVRQGGFAANVEDAVDYLYKVAHEEDKND